jgi:uncharacterized membrane protein
MSEPAAATTPPPPATTTDERVLPGIVYGLYFLQLFTGFTVLIGVIMAYVLRDRATEVTRSHYDFLIATFWKAIFPLLVSIVAFVVGLVLSIVLIGIPILMGAVFMFAAICVWYLIRCVVGAVYLAQNQAHPRPETWLA